jgi:hypothetical protein
MEFEAREMGGRATVLALQNYRHFLPHLFLSPAIAGLKTLPCFDLGLHPRLYAYACSAG